MEIDLHKLAALAALSLSPEKEEQLRRDLERMIALTDALCAEPGFLTDGPETPGALRKDVAKPSLSRDRIVAAAPGVPVGFVAMPYAAKEGESCSTPT